MNISEELFNEFSECSESLQKTWLQSCALRAPGKAHLYKKLGMLLNFPDIQAREFLQEIQIEIIDDNDQAFRVRMRAPNFNINTKIYDNQNLLGFAAQVSAIKIFRLLLVNGASIDGQLKWAIQGGNEEIVQMMIEESGSIQPESLKPFLTLSARYFQPHIFQWLVVQMSVQPEQKDIDYIQKNGDLLSLMFVVEELNVTGEIACQPTETIEYLMSKGWDYKDVHWVFARRGILSFFQNMATDEINPSCVFYAINGRQTEMLKYLLYERGIKPPQRDENNINLLCAAIKTEDMEIIDIALNYGGSAEGALRTAIYTSQANRLAIVRKILKAGVADINEVDKHSDMTPLHMAVLQKSTSVVALLIKYGADKSLTNPIRTATEVAPDLVPVLKGSVVLEVEDDGNVPKRCGCYLI